MACNQRSSCAFVVACFGVVLIVALMTLATKHGLKFSSAGLRGKSRESRRLQSRALAFKAWSEQDTQKVNAENAIWEAVFPLNDTRRPHLNSRSAQIRERYC